MPPSNNEVESKMRLSTLIAVSKRTWSKKLNGLHHFIVVQVSFLQGGLIFRERVAGLEKLPAAAPMTKKIEKLTAVRSMITKCIGYKQQLQDVVQKRLIPDVQNAEKMLGGEMDAWHNLIQLDLGAPFNFMSCEVYMDMAAACASQFGHDLTKHAQDALMTCQENQQGGSSDWRVAVQGKESLDEDLRVLKSRVDIIDGGKLSKDTAGYIQAFDWELWSLEFGVWKSELIDV